MATNHDTTELQELASRANSRGFELNHRPGHIFEYQLVGPMVTIEGLDEMLDRLEAPAGNATDTMDEEVQRALHGFSLRALSLKSTADLLASFADDCADPGSVAALIASEAYQLNQDTFDLAEKLGSRTAAATTDATAPNSATAMLDNNDLAEQVSAQENINRQMWNRLQEYQRENAKRPVEEIFRELERHQWDTLDRGYDSEFQDRYLSQHSWSRKGLDLMLALAQLHESIHPDEGGKIGRDAA